MRFAIGAGLGADSDRFLRGDGPLMDQLGFVFDPPSPSAPSPAAPRAANDDVRRAAEPSPGSAAPSAPSARSADAATVAPPRARGRAARRAQEARLLHRLVALGLRDVERVSLMHTRRTMVSLIGRTLRVHEGFADAPEPVLRAIVTFAVARTRAARDAARDVILAHPVQRPPAKRRPEAPRPGDAGLLAALAEAHRMLNARHFGGALRTIPVRLSGRMKTRLGHYSPAGEDADEAEIALNRRHVKRDGWGEAVHTLLHEMVHQWQDETGHPLDHGPAFRRKAREVGVLPRAKRPID